MRKDNLWLKILFATSMSLVLPSNSNAMGGDQRGNGGGGVVCRNDRGNITSVTTLDIYEADFRGMNLDFGPPSESPLEIVNHLLNRLATIDPLAAVNYRKLANRFYDPNVSRFKKGITLPFTEDTGFIALPLDCKLEQIVLQQEPQVPEDRLFVINQDLYEHLDTRSQAALILHEVIYNELISMKNKVGDRIHPTSFYARYFNEKLISDTFISISAEDYIASFGDTHDAWTRPFRGCLLKDRMHGVNWRGLLLDLCSSSVAPVDGAPSKYKLIDGQLLNRSIRGIQGLNFSSEREFSEIKISENELHGISIKFLIENHDAKFNESSISIKVSAATEFPINIGPKIGIQIDLDPAGHIRRFAASSMYSFYKEPIHLTLNHSSEIFADGSLQLLFDENGNRIL